MTRTETGNGILDRGTQPSARCGRGHAQDGPQGAPGTESKSRSITYVTTTKPASPCASGPDRYVRLPQAILDRRKTLHAQLLDAMQAQGFYTPSGAKKFSGYAELIRDFLYWYFGLTTGTMIPVGSAAMSVPGGLDALASQAVPVSEDRSAVPGSDDLASDDLVTGYFGFGR